MGDAEEPEVQRRHSGLSRGAVQAMAVGGVLVGCALWAAWHASHPVPAPPAPSPSVVASPASPQVAGPVLVVQADPGAQILLDGSPAGRVDVGGTWTVPAGLLQAGTRYQVSAVLGNRSTRAEFLARSGQHILDLRQPAGEPTPEGCLARIPGLGPCLSVAPPRPTPEPRVGPCLKVRATPEPPLDLVEPSPRLGPCLSVVNPENLPPTPSPPSPRIRVCLSPAPQSWRPPAEPEGQRRSLLARFWDRLRPDLRERLGGGDEA